MFQNTSPVLSRPDWLTNNLCPTHLYGPVAGAGAFLVAGAFAVEVAAAIASVTRGQHTATVSSW